MNYSVYIQSGNRLFPSDLPNSHLYPYFQFSNCFPLTCFKRERACTRFLSLPGWVQATNTEEGPVFVMLYGGQMSSGVITGVCTMYSSLELLPPPVVTSNS